MLAPIDTSIVPPGGMWRVTDDNGATISHNHIKSFLGMVFKMREANGLYTGSGWEDDVFDLMCKQHPEIMCKEVGAPERYLSLDDIRRFGHTLAAFVAGGGKWVEKQDAERRAAICVTCPHNKEVAGCWGCKGIMNWLMELIGTHSTSQDDKIHGCDICLCALRAKVHMPLDAIDNTGLVYPDYCWQFTQQ